MDSPRGRIYLMKLAADGKSDMNPQWVSHFDSCLGCMACMTACPSGVDYSKLIEATRSQIERNHHRSMAEKLYRRLIFSMFTRPDRLRMLRLPLLAYQKTGARALLRRTGILNLLPKQLRAMEALMPQLGAARIHPERDSSSELPAASRRSASRLRAGRILSSSKRSNRSRARGRRLRSRRAARSTLLRRTHGSRWRRSLRRFAGAQNHRRLRKRKRRHDHHQRRRMRLQREGVRSSPARRSPLRRPRKSILLKM